MNAFAVAGWPGLVMIAPVTSEDERIFVLSSEAFRALGDRAALEQVMQQILCRKAWIVEQSASWPVVEPFH
jgi:hypothetical protein